MARQVLVLEDDPPMEHLLCRIVREEGHEVRVAQSWKDFEQALLGELPDLMLIDIALPWVNGLDLNESLGESAAFQGIPRVIVTGHAEAAYRLRAYAQGCRAFVAKPFEVDQLQVAIREALAQAETPEECLDQDYPLPPSFKSSA